MARSAPRQVTPSIGRVWSYGVLATVVATALNLGWLRLVTRAFGWTVQVPVLVNTSELVVASDWRIATATATVGVAATAGCATLARTVIGPRVWWAIIGTAGGFASIYGLMTVGGLDITVRVRLLPFHVLALVVLLPALYRALQVSDSDLRKAMSRFQEHIEPTAATATTSTATPQASTSISVDEPTPIDLPPTLLAPESLVGLSEDAALTSAAAADCEVRITSRDGIQFTTTRDFRADRVNLEIVDGRVTAASMG